MKALSLVLLMFTPLALHGQDPRIRARDQQEFLDKARAAAAQYVVQEDALLDGYRPIGPELPAMGQHWLNPEFANLGYVDPARPAFLLYATVDGRPVLAGMGFTIALKPGEKMPGLPAGRAAWHEHAGSVADEAFAVSHESVDDESRFRVVALHIWHAVPAPDGMFSAENWNLPYFRKGMTAPTPFDAGAARVLGMTGGGDGYYTNVLVRHAGLDEVDRARIASVLAEYGQRAGANAAALPQLYDAMWEELLAAVSPGKRAQLASVKSIWAHSAH